MIHPECTFHAEIYVNMHESVTLDAYDLRLLAALQEDARLTNQQLADLVHLSPSQCSRRRAGLERAGIIGRYRTELAADRLGFTVTAFINVSLATHSSSSARRFREMIWRASLRRCRMLKHGIGIEGAVPSKERIGDSNSA